MKTGARFTEYFYIFLNVWDLIQCLNFKELAVRMSVALPGAEVGSSSRRGVGGPRRRPASDRRRQHTTLLPDQKVLNL